MNPSPPSRAECDYKLSTTRRSRRISWGYPQDTCSLFSGGTVCLDNAKETTLAGVVSGADRQGAYPGRPIDLVPTYQARRPSGAAFPAAQATRRRLSIAVRHSAPAPKFRIRWAVTLTSSHTDPIAAI